MKLFILILSTIYTFNFSLIGMEGHQFSTEDENYEIGNGYQLGDITIDLDEWHTEVNDIDDQNRIQLSDEEIKLKICQEAETMIDSGITPLIWSILSNYSDKAHLFINTEDLNQQTVAGDTALSFACSFDNINLVYNSLASWCKS